MTDYLRIVSNHFDLYRNAVPILAKGLERSGGETIIDLASGSGGGWAKLVEHLGGAFPQLRVILTDRYPNEDGVAAMIDQSPLVFSFEPTSIDARAVPSHLRGLRTQFLSFHHFDPTDASKILQDAVDARQPIAIVEAQKRDLSHLAKFALSPIAVGFMTPMIRPLKCSRLVLTYLIPVIPLFIFWDGLVSVLRTYSVQEMHSMVAALRDGDSYEWEIGESNSGSNLIQYLLGYPKNENRL